MKTKVTRELFPNGEKIYYVSRLHPNGKWENLIYTWDKEEDAKEYAEKLSIKALKEVIFEYGE